MTRHILHADLDAFYASIEQRDNPEIRGKPVIVGGSPKQRGVVAAASYEARNFGVHSAMPMKTAIRLCPQAIRMLPRFDVYRQTSRQIMAIFRLITPLIEPLSLDEAFLDITDQISQNKPPESIAANVKHRVRAETGLTCSIGLATSKSVAKVASGINKPNGITIVPPGQERVFLSSLPVDKLWGIGPKTAKMLAFEDIKTIGRLATKSEQWARRKLGKNGPFMLNLARGKDDRPLITDRVQKSVSAETTLTLDSDEPDALEEIVTRLSQRVGRELRKAQLQGRTVRLKFRLSNYTTFTRQKTTSEFIDSAANITTTAQNILRNEMTPGRNFRLLGVSVSGFDESEGEGEGSPKVVQPRLTGLE